VTVSYLWLVADDPRRYIRIHADLSARIADSRLPSGTILNIGAIADEWGVARETVQRSIRMLADDGLVTRFPGIGWQVN
jgi:DNA-binding GntR family transcriptional regulator